MSRGGGPAGPRFDDADLQQGLRLSGEDKQHFARRRIEHLGRCLGQARARVQRVLDFGCGAGESCPLLLELPGARRVVGVDASPRLVARARALDRARGADPERLSYMHSDEQPPDGSFDLVYCNGVFHHIDPAERPAALRYIRGCLRPGGLLALWENNPWNLGAQLVMRRIPFDRDARPIAPLAAWRLVRRCGLAPLRFDALFIFPRALAWLRPLERLVQRLPLGAQYQLLCRREG